MQHLTDEELSELLEQADAALIREGVPPAVRPQAALAELWPDVTFPVVERERAEALGGPAVLLWRVNDWFEHRYGAKATPRRDLGRVPVLVRNEVFLARIPLGFGEPTLQPLKMLEHLTDGMRQSLREHEAREIREAYAEALALVYELDDVRPFLLQPSVESEAQELGLKAFEDRNTAARCFEDPPDTNGACFHAQQHAEKLMKLYLRLKEGMQDRELRRLSHRLMEAFELCVESEPAFEPLRPEVETVAQVEMGFRYTVPAVPAQPAVEIFWAALRVGAASACFALDVERRGDAVRYIPPPGHDAAVSRRRHETIEKEWVNIVENHRVAVEHWGTDVAVLVLDLRDPRARAIALATGQSIQEVVQELDAPGNHRMSATLSFGLPRREVAELVGGDRAASVERLKDPPATGTVLVTMVSSGGFDTFAATEADDGALSMSGDNG